MVLKPSQGEFKTLVAGIIACDFAGQLVFSIALVPFGTILRVNGDKGVSVFFDTLVVTVCGARYSICIFLAESGCVVILLLRVVMAGDLSGGRRLKHGDRA